MMLRSTLILLCLLTLIAPTFAQDSTLPPVYHLENSRLSHVYETTNNCGPATLTMAMSFYGFPIAGQDAQNVAADYLKPKVLDGNVSFWQMEHYINDVVGGQYGLKSIFRRGGDFELVKTLIANDFPVVMGKALELAGADKGWFGHYVLLVGYDDVQQVFLTFDSQLGHGDMAGIPVAYDEVAVRWGQFNNIYFVLYDESREAMLQTLMGDHWDDNFGLDAMRADAQTRVDADDSDLWAWFNLGESLAYLGQYDDAGAAFDRAFDRQASGAIPPRAIWYMHGAFIAYYETGQFQKLENLVYRAEAFMNGTVEIEDMSYYQALVRASQGKTDSALAMLDQVLTFNPNYFPATEAKDEILSGSFASIPECGC